MSALTRAAAEPSGALLTATRGEPGLFPATAAAKPALERCIQAGWLSRLDTDPQRVTLTPAGQKYLLDQANPRQILEDFCRVLESRQTAVTQLQSTLIEMAASLAQMSHTVRALLPNVAGDRVRPVAVSRLQEDDLSEVLLQTLYSRHRAEGPAQDTPLPELFATLMPTMPNLTIGRFHDALRQLHRQRQIYVHPWTGPLYTLPEPKFALLVGHEVAYYASPAGPDVRSASAIAATTEGSSR
ncbi:MAG: hypothetical protein ACRCZF_08105 [Gemmataceae bacterium]